MAGSLADGTEASLLDHLFAIATMTEYTAMWAALYTATPSDAGGGTECTGGSYARDSIGIGGTNWTRATSTVTNDNNIDFVQATAGWGTVTAMGVFSLVTAGVLYFWDDFTGVAINTDDTARFPANTGITVTLD
jgi:hypothetical protein